MHDPLSPAELSAKFQRLTTGLAPARLAGTLHSTLEEPTRPVTHLTEALRSDGDR